MKLTTAARKAIPAGKFAGPGRSFPGNKLLTHKERIQAIAGIVAKVKNGTQPTKGNLSPASAAKIRAKANKVLSK